MNPGAIIYDSESDEPLKEHSLFRDYYPALMSEADYFDTFEVRSTPRHYS